jgi:G:T-mismatch repair DNA endonuclease (very short patch repair protein)
MKPVWNKGLTKDMDPRVVSVGSFKKGHIPWCKGLSKEDPKIVSISNKLKGSIPWNKGLSKEVDGRLVKLGRKTGETLKTKFESGELVAWSKGLTKETDKRIKSRSESQERNNKIRRSVIALRIEKYSRIGDGFFFNTKPELEMKRCLEELGIHYIFQYPVNDIEHCYVADFYLPLYNIVLEVDGKWSHSYPDGLERDFIRTKEMEEKGYRVIRFWEGEFSPSQIWNSI